MKILFYSAVLAIALLGFRNVSMAADALKTGDKAPNFNLPNAKGDLVSLSSYQNNWVVLYFYPKDDTPSCTKEACSFRDDLHKLDKLGAKVIGVSVDDGASHAEFAKKYNLSFPLLSDKNGVVANQYGALSNFVVFKIAKRYTFLISPDGLLQKSYLNIDTSRHSQQIIDDLTAILQAKL